MNFFKNLFFKFHFGCFKCSFFDELRCKWRQSRNKTQNGISLWSSKDFSLSVENVQTCKSHVEKCNWHANKSKSLGSKREGMIYEV